MKIEVKVYPNAKENKVEQERNIFKIHVNASATNGKANEKMIELLSEFYDVPKSQISIVRGQTSKNKLIKILT